LVTSLQSLSNRAKARSEQCQNAVANKRRIKGLEWDLQNSEAARKKPEDELKEEKRKVVDADALLNSTHRGKKFCFSWPALFTVYAFWSW
jgi:hypothetical protein